MARMKILELKILDIFRYFIYLIFLHSTLHQCLGQDLVKISSCVFKFSNGKVMNLTLVSPEFYSSQYRGHDSKIYTYYFKPCTPFQLGEPGSECGSSKVYVCQAFRNGSALIYSNIGNIGTEKVVSDGENISLNYNGLAGIKKTSVALKCGNATKFEVMTAGPVDAYEMTFYSHCACDDGCVENSKSNVHNSTGHASSLSMGSVLLIIFFTGSTLYVFGGIFCMFCMRGARGRELIPNYEFWMDFPLLVRDGVLFSASGCKAETRYERI